MTVTDGAEVAGATPLPKARMLMSVPFVRHREDVPHEAALPDLYGELMAGQRRAERQSEVRAMIRKSKLLRVQEDWPALGLMVVRLLAKPVGEYIDLYVTPDIGSAGKSYLRRFEAALGATFYQLMVESASVSLPHPQIPMSTSYHTVRLCKRMII